jgi:RNA polymerase sigma-70 factor, ECF subfamily
MHYTLRRASIHAVPASRTLERRVNGEAELLERIATGDERALEELHFVLAPKVFALALRMLRVKEEAEEVLQDTFVHVFRDTARRGAGAIHPRAFVFTITRNLCLSRLRARNARPVIAPDLEYEDLGSVSGVVEPSDGVNRVVVRAALARLAVDERTLLEEMYFDGWTHTELSERTGLPLGTVKAKLRRALLKLRGILEPA